MKRKSHPLFRPLARTLYQGLSSPSSQSIFLPLWLVLFFLVAAGCQSRGHDRSQGYSIRVSLLNGAKDSLIFSAYEGTALRRIQVLLPEGGHAAFKGSPALPPGMYLLEIKDKTSIPLFISEGASQNFSLSADPGKMPASLKIDGSPENSAFVNYQMLLHSLQPREASLRKRTQLSGGNRDSVAVISAEFNKLAAERTSREKQIANRFPGSTLELFLRSSREPDLPEPPIDPSLPNHEQRVQEYYFRYMTLHFFDRTDFSDPRTAAMPLLEQRARYYFQQMVSPLPDSLIAHTCSLLEKPGIHPIVSRQLTRFLFDLFKTSPLPEHRQVAALIAEKFILPRKTLFTDSGFTAKAEHLYTKYLLNPVGETATDLQLKTPEGQTIRLSEVRSPYTILFFYNPECEACGPVTDELLHLWKETRLKENAAVIAVYLGTNSQLWKDYLASKGMNGWLNVFDPSGGEKIEEKYDLYAMPMIYLLDRNKRVIARDLPANRLLNYIPLTGK